MAVFNKDNKADRSFDEIYDDLFADNGGDAVSTITPWEEKTKKIKAPHALTAEEVLSGKKDGAAHENVGGSLFKKVMNDYDGGKKMFKPSGNRDDSQNRAKTVYRPKSSLNTDPAAVNAAEVDVPPKPTAPEPSGATALTESAAARQPAAPVRPTENIRMNPPVTVERKISPEAGAAIDSLLKKCVSYITDDSAGTVSDADIKADVSSVISSAEKSAHNRVKNVYGNTVESETAARTAAAETPSAARTAAPKQPAKRIPVKLKIMNPEKDDSIIKGAEAETAHTARDNNIFSSPENIGAEAPPTPDVPQKAPVGQEKTAVFDAVGKAADDEIPMQQLKSAVDSKTDDMFSENGGEYAENEGDYAENEDVVLAPTREYHGLDDAAEIGSDLISLRRGSRIRAAITAVIAVFSAVFALPSVYGALGLGDAAINIIGVVMLVLAMLVNFKTFAASARLYYGQKTIDVIPAASALVSLIYAAVTVSNSSHPSLILVPAAASALAFNELGHSARFSSVISGFSRIATSTRKKAVTLHDCDLLAKNIAGREIEGDVLLASSKKTTVIDGFINNSFAPNPFDRKLLSAAVAAAVAAVAALVFGYLKTGSLAKAAVFIPFALCAANIPVFSLTSALPIKKLAESFSEECGGAFGGYRAIDSLSECNAVSLDAIDLFPKGTVILSKMHILGMNEIDKTLIRAAALSVEAESPIGAMLKKLIGGDVKEFPAVEAFKYEKGMGISGWVDGMNILVGNRDLMIGHNIKLPPVSVDNKILTAGFFPVYIACDQNPCALLIVKYVPNERVAFDLQNACRLGVSVFVRSTDPNVTSQMIADYFGVYDDCVSVMSKPAAEMYADCAEYSERCAAPAAFRGSSHALLKLVNASCAVKSMLKILSFLFAVIAAASLLVTVNSASLAAFSLIAAAVVPAAQLLCAIIAKAVSSASKKLR